MMTELFRLTRAGSEVSMSVNNGASKVLPASFFAASEGVGGDGKYTVEADGDYEFNFSAEAVWQSASFGSGAWVTDGYWVLWVNGAEASGPVPNGVSIRLTLKAGDVVQPAPYASGIKGTTSGNPTSVSLTAVGGLAHWQGRQWA